MMNFITCTHLHILLYHKIKANGMGVTFIMNLALQMKNAYIFFFVGKRKRKRPLGRSRRGWENNIKMDVTYCLKKQ